MDAQDGGHECPRGQQCPGENATVMRQNLALLSPANLGTRDGQAGFPRAGAGGGGQLLSRGCRTWGTGVEQEERKC